MFTHTPTRLNILSDLHLSRGAMPLPDVDTDVVILAGDIARPPQAIQWALGFARPVLYVAGNHEFYGSGVRRTLDDLRRRCAGTHIHILDDDELILRGIRFLGATLWTDFMLFGEGPQRELAIKQGMEFMRDFSRIQSDAEPGKTFTPRESQELFNGHRSWLEHKLSQPFDGPTVVITHHAPSPKSIHPRFAGSAINACFVSDVESLMGAQRAALWIHGHTHDSFDYTVSGTRVVCNPRGYSKNNVNENPLFDPNLVVTIG